jgi:hypothetical protein
MNLQPSQRTFCVWLATVVLLIVVAIAYQPPRSVPAVRIISLHVDFNDNQTKTGGGAEFHQGNAVYKFRNEYLEPIKLAFPPIGYTFGGVVPLTPQCTDHSRMPTFCLPARIIELKLGESQTFESKYTLSGPAGSPVEHFVFGPASDPDTKNVFVGEIISTSRIHPAR